MKRKGKIIVFFNISVIIISTLFIFPARSIFFHGVKVISSGWQEHIALDREIYTQPYINNIIKDIDNTILDATKVFWDFYDYQGNYYPIWNETLEFYRETNESNILLYKCYSLDKSKYCI